jgi:hypothetical protein
LPFRQGNLPSHDVGHFPEKSLELSHRVLSIVGNSQGMRPIAHIKMMPTWLRGGLKPNLTNFLMKTRRLHGAHLAMGCSFLRYRYALV